MPKSSKRSEEEFQEEFFGLLFGADDDADPAERIAALKKAVDLADSHGDIRAGMTARIEYIRITEFSGRYDESLVAFTWCLGICDKHPDILEDYSEDILWIFKWIAKSVTQYPSVSRAQVEETIRQMAKYYEHAGLSPRAIHDARANAAVDFGDTDQIPALRDAWQAAPKDGSEDCLACETHSLLQLAITTCDYRQALTVGRPLLEGRLTCTVQPHCAQSALLMPLIRLRKWSLADEAQRKSARKIRGNTNHLDCFGPHIAFLTFTDQLTRAVAMLEGGFAHLIHVHRPNDQMSFFKGARLLLKRLSTLHRSHVKLRIPTALDFHRPDSKYPVPELLALVESRGTQIAAAFDKRNANTTISHRFLEWDDLLSQIHPL